MQPDLIVLDVMLPDIDGFTVTRRIRQEGINALCCFSPLVTTPKTGSWA